MACFFLPLTTITLSGLAPDKFAAATSLSNFFRTLAGSIGTSITITLWSRGGSFHHSNLSESISNFNVESVELIKKLSAEGFDLTQSLQYIDTQVTEQSLLLSANDIFYYSSGIFLMLTLIVWFARPPFNTKPVA